MILVKGNLKSFEQYKTDLGQRESGGNYNSQNSYGYTGKYQFGTNRLRDLGYKGTLSAFRSNPQLQEEYFIKHVQDHAKHLAGLVATAKAKRGQHVTLSGLIAGAHLGGRGGVAKYIAGTDYADANGTKVSSYVNQFSGYEIPGYDETTNAVIKTANFNAANILPGGIENNKLLVTIAAAAGITIFINLFRKF